MAQVTITATFETNPAMPADDLPALAQNLFGLINDAYSAVQMRRIKNAVDPNLPPEMRAAILMHCDIDVEVWRQIVGSLKFTVTQ